MTSMPTGAMKPDIVRITVEQVASIVPLFVDYSAFYGRTVTPDDAHTFLHEGLATGESVIFGFFSHVVAGDSTAGGFLQMHPSRSSKLLGRRWIVNDLYVSPELRRQRIGQCLLTAAHAYARETGAKDLRLSTKVTNHVARALYESLGWMALDEFVTYELRVAPDEAATH
jgi:ribosomal protein S18 acetylase RimI-like enzyme